MGWEKPMQPHLCLLPAVRCRMHPGRRAAPSVIHLKIKPYHLVL